MLAMLLLLIDSEEDQRKFEELYHRYKQLMFHVSRDYFHTESAVEDAVQEAFIRIIKNFSKIGEINCPQTKHFIVLEALVLIYYGLGKERGWQFLGKMFRR